MSNQPPNNGPWQQGPPQQPFPSQQPNQQQPSFQPYPQQPPMPPPAPPKKKRGPLFWVLLVIGALLVCGACSGIVSAISRLSTTATTSTATTKATNTPVPTDTPQPTDTPTPAPSLAYQLASIDSGGSVSSNDAVIAKYQTLLDTLHRKTGDSEQTIADETVAGRDLVKTKYGKDVTLLDLLQNADQSLPEGTKIHYNEVLAAYMGS